MMTRKKYEGWARTEELLKLQELLNTMERREHLCDQWENSGDQGACYHHEVAPLKRQVMKLIMEIAMKTVTLPDFLTEDQIKKVVELETHEKITKEVIAPNQKQIEEKLGQAIDPDYFGYLCEYVVSQVKSMEKNFQDLGKNDR